ncbi:MAG: tetratricopeptide repeat protein [Cyanobacteriota bacterium]|nr:tetratricopeptide repeat protein [Cyanobacteriota bacterium]
MKKSAIAKLAATILSCAGLWVETSPPKALAAPGLHTTTQSASTSALVREAGRDRLLAQTNPLSPATINGRLDSNSPVLSDDNSYYNTHTFEGKTGEQLVIELTSSEFDSYLILFDPESNQIADDDDGGEGNNSRIIVTLPATGTYTIFANSYEAGETGNYTLSWRVTTAEDLELAEAQQLNRQVIQLDGRGQYAAALPFAERALAIFEKALGTNHPDVALSLNNLAELYRKMGNYSAAEPLYQRSLEIREKALGAEHPNVATSLNNLASLYSAIGNYSTAEPLFQRSLAIREQARGAEHPDVALSLDNLASLYQKMGNYSAAESLLQRSLAISEKARGAEHPNVATSLNNLASLYSEMENYSAAEPLFQRSLAIFEKALGGEHPDVATSLNNLASLYSAIGNYSAAEPFYQRSLAISEKVLGAEHPHVSKSLNNLALLYQKMRNYSAAEPLYQRSLAISEKVLGAEHPDVATSLNNLAGLYQARGHISLATEFLQRGTDIEENNLSLIFTTGSESEKRAYLKTLAGTTNATISLHLQAAPNNPEAARLALTTVLRRKGRILDALTESLDLLRQNLTPENQALLEQLATKRTQLANLIYKQPENLPLEQYRQQVATLKAEAEQLESELSRRSAEFRTETQPVTLEAVQALIPTDTALVEIVQYKPFNSKTDNFGMPRYAAYILKSTGEPRWVDLGEAEPIDQAVKAFRQGLTRRSRRSRARVAGRALDELLMQPIRAQLGNTQNLLLSPDGQLNLIPFAALIDENEQYLVENYRITYLTTGRDLLRLSISSPSGQPPVFLANPDYDRSLGDATVALLSPSPPRSGEGNRGVAQNRRSGEIEDLSFDPLPGTAEEAAAIAPLLENVTLLTEARATENALKQVRSPQILHVATHGFFLDVDLVAPPDNRFSSSENSSLIAARPSSGATPSTPGQQENPLLRSGLALAGINARQSGEEDGVLTALETAHLNLRGTQLAVLSACETGVGETANGEGVYGLRRALVIAGAESQVMSLWAVSDEGTKDLMVEYYQRLLRGEGRSEALRQVQLEMLSEQRYSHPFFWAAFIPSGEWGAME